MEMFALGTCTFIWYIGAWKGMIKIGYDWKILMGEKGWNNSLLKCFKNEMQNDF